MSIFIVDVESDGPIPNKYSMVCFGCVKVDKYLRTNFYGQTKPVSNEYIPEALAVSGFTRQQHLEFQEPQKVMIDFVKWVKSVSNERPILMTDNLAYDWSWINYYCHYYANENPFGFSGRRIGDLFAGLNKNFFAANEWKKLRQTRHSHNPVDDAKGNAEALLKIAEQYNLRLPL